MAELPPNMYFFPDEESRILPFDVRFALQYRKAKISVKDIETLVKSGFLRFGFYLAMKSATEDDEIQATLLHKMANNGFDFSNLTINDIEPALERLRQKEDPTVPGGKLAQVSRHGFRNWAVGFHNTLDKLDEAYPGAPLFTVADSTYYGIDVLAAHSVLQGRPLGILKPDRYKQPERPVGFVLEPGFPEITVSSLPNDFERPPGAVIFDDVLNSGSVLRKTVEYWSARTEDVPIFKTAVEVHSYT